MVNTHSTCLQCWRLRTNSDYSWRGIAYVWCPMTFTATSNMHKFNYVTDMIGWSRVQRSLLGEARRTERAAEIEPTHLANINKQTITGLLTFPLLAHVFNEVELGYITLISFSEG